VFHQNAWEMRLDQIPDPFCDLDGTGIVVRAGRGCSLVGSDHSRL
jgi:hypothetical protein